MQTAVLESLRKYVIDEKTKTRCEKFSKDVTETTKDNYFNRNQYNIEKLQKDHYYGKLGEIGVLSYLREEKFLIKKSVDFKLYSKNRKNFDADIVTEDGKNFHVKTQHYESANMFQTSWMFEKTDPLVAKPTDNDYIAFCMINKGNLLGELVVEVLRIIKAKDIIFGDPVKNLPSKTCIYWDFNKHLKNFM